jgi:hypothetical protein
MSDFTDIKTVSDDVPQSSTPMARQAYRGDISDDEEYVDYTDEEGDRKQAVKEARRVAAVGIFLVILGLFLLIHSIVDIATVGTNGTNTSLIIIAAVVLIPGCWQAVRSWRFFCVEGGVNTQPDSEDMMSL